MQIYVASIQMYLRLLSQYDTVPTFLHRSRRVIIPSETVCNIWTPRFSTYLNGTVDSSGKQSETKLDGKRLASHVRCTLLLTNFRDS